MILEFDWDQWNIQKNEIKHGVAKLEAESIFYDPKLKILNDLKHSTNSEKRFICYGYSLRNRVLMIAFTIRQQKVRIISTRTASKGEKML